MQALHQNLPDDVRAAAITSGEELVLPYAEALRAVEIATEHQIAILGLEAFEVQSGGLLTVDMADASGYIPFAGDWQAYFTALNREAERWILDHPLGENHGYILTSASKTEFASLARRVK